MCIRDRFKLVGEQKGSKEVPVTTFYEPKFGTILSDEPAYKKVTRGKKGQTYAEQLEEKKKEFTQLSPDLAKYTKYDSQGAYSQLSYDIQKELLPKYQGRVTKSNQKIIQEQFEKEVEKEFEKRSRILQRYYRQQEGDLYSRPTGEAIAKYAPVAIETGALVGASVLGGPVGQILASSYIYRRGFADTTKGSGMVRRGEPGGYITVGLGVGQMALGITGFSASQRALERSIMKDELVALSKQKFNVRQVRVGTDKTLSLIHI